MIGRLSRWLFDPVPKGRIAAFRTLVYLFVAADLVIFTPWVRSHAHTPAELYQPLLIGRILPLPTPTSALVNTIFWVLLALALVAASGRAPRLLGWTVFLLYLEWMIIAMSYGKVDHDRFGLLVALAVLPTVGRARHRDPSLTDSGGWALRVTQLAVIATYFLAAFAKLRFGGLDWLTSSVLAQAIIRRGTDLADLIAGVPGLLILSQFGIMAFELLSPVVFVVPPRWRTRIVAFFYAFHLATFSAITISFAPHLVAMASFLPLEKLQPSRLLLLRRRPAGSGAPGGAGGGSGAADGADRAGLDDERAEPPPPPGGAPAPAG